MSHDFSGIMFNSHHYTHPFSCSCDEADVREQHSLSLSQRVFIVAISILIAIPTFGVGGIASFYLLSAALKARNVTWVSHTSAHPNFHERVSFFEPAYWGFNAVVVPRTSYSSHYSAPHPTYTTYHGGHHVSVGVNHSTSANHVSYHMRVRSGDTRNSGVSARSVNQPRTRHGGHHAGRSAMGGHTVSGSSRMPRR